MNNASQTVSSFTDRISKSASTLQGFGQVGMHAMGIMDRFEISSMNVSNALMSVQDAQMRYNSALQEFGAGTEQAVLAQNSLERATNQYEAAQMRANLSLATMGITMFGMLPQILKFGSTAVTTLRNVEIATLLTTAKIRAMAPELLILSAIAGGTYYLWTQSAQQTQTATEKLTTSVITSTTSVKLLREQINKITGEIEELSKPKRQPQSLMDQFLEYQATGKMPEKIIPEQTAIEKKKVEKAKLIDALYIEETIQEHQETSAASASSSAMQILKERAPISPTYGRDRAEAEPSYGQTTMNVTINATINKNDDVGRTFRNIGEGLYNGYTTANMKPR